MTAAASIHGAPAASVTVDDIGDEQGVLALTGEWSALLRGCTSATLFQTPEWATAWWQQYGRHRRGAVVRSVPRVLAVRRGAVLLAVVPLVLEEERRCGVGVRILRLLGHELADYSGAIVGRESDTPDVFRAIAAHLAGAADTWDEIDLREMTGADDGEALSAALTGERLPVAVQIDSECGFIAVDGEWKDFYERRFDARRRKEHRRQWRRLEEHGQYAIAFVSAIDPALIEQLAAVQRDHPAAGADRHGIFNEPSYRPFFDAWLALCARRGWLQVATLSVAGRIVAYFLVFLYGRRAYLYSTAYTTSMAPLGGGRLLLMRLLEHLWSSGFDEVDLLRGDEAYKRTWTTAVRRNVRLTATSPAYVSGPRAIIHRQVLPRLSRWARTAGLRRGRS